jgi:hypothetical protein
MPIGGEPAIRAFYMQHFLGKVFTCPYCKTLTTFGPDWHSFLSLNCPWCRTRYNIGFGAVRYQLGDGLYPLPVPEGRSFTPVNSYWEGSALSTAYYYPLDLFMRYINVGAEDVERDRLIEKLEQRQTQHVQRITDVMHGQAPLSEWQTLHDALGLFTIRFPPGWSASSEESQEHEGRRMPEYALRTNLYPTGPRGPVLSITSEDSRIFFATPDLRPHLLADIGIHAWLLTPDQYQAYVSDPQLKGPSFHGYPTMLQPANVDWISFPTPRAFFVIVHHRHYEPLEFTVKNIVDRIIDSFQLVDPEPSQ